MNQDLLVRQSAVRDLSKPVAASAGPDRVAGSAPPSPSSEAGPANPRLRVDRDLGVLVIEFRDMTGKVSVSVPTPRELDAYRAAIVYGIDLPSDISPNGQSAEALLRTRPGLPPMQEAPLPLAERVSLDNGEGLGVDRVA
jgi:hypothetical protein